MSRYLYAVICGNSHCRWADPELREVQWPTIRQARRDLRIQSNGVGCGWCGSSRPSRIVRRPISKWEEMP